MKKFITLGINNIKYIIEKHDIEPMYAGLGSTEPWNEDLEGSYMEHYVDGRIPNYVRIGVMPDGVNIALFEKSNFNKLIIDMVDIKALTYRIVQREQSKNDDDYIEFYGDLFDDVIRLIMPEIVDCLYINAYDYMFEILDPLIDKDYYKELQSQTLPEHDVYITWDNYYRERKQTA